MNKQILEKQLKELGLGEIEIKIYLRLLASGQLTPLELSRDLNIDRSKIYRNIEVLLGRKLIEQSYDRWGKRFKAASPQNLALIIRDEEEQLVRKKALVEPLLSELSRLPSLSKREFEIHHYRGQEGLRQMLWNQLSAKGEIVAFSYRNKNDIVGKTYAEKIREEQVRRKIKLFEIENETDQGDYWYTDVIDWEKYYDSRYISPKVLDIKQYIAVFGNIVSVINWIDKEEVGLEIVNDSYAAMQSAMFWQFWSLAGAHKK